jgi:hypothetical protein
LEPEPKFGKRFFAALLSSSLAFVPIYVWAAVSALSRSDVQRDLAGWASNALTVFVICEVIMVVAIFVIAYPVETWLVKPKDTGLRSAAKYFLIGLATTLVSLLLVFTSIAKVYTAWSWWPIYLFFGSIIGTYTACVGRLIYPRLLKVLTSKAEAVTETI